MELPVVQASAGPILGIDLGTTHSLVAVLERGVPRVLLGEGGDPLLPSVVSFPRGGKPVVGRAALERAALDPQRTIHSSKRLIGRARADLGADADALPYAVVDAPDRAMAVVDLGERTVSPQEVAGFVLAACRRRAAQALGMPEKRLGRAVITVPAYFDDAQRQATRDAARFAGLEVVRMVNEPTAAALAYGLDARGAQRVAVYDLGGGTFDLSVLELDDGVYRVLATCGDTRLGGDDFDGAIVTRMAAEMRAQTGVDVLADAGARAALRMIAEQVKQRLSSVEEAEFVYRDAAAGIAWRRTIGVIEFQNWIAPLVQRTLDLCDRALADAGLAKHELDEIVLVGGSTRVPLVRAAVRAWGGREPNARLDPDQVVALGAAVQAGVLGGQVAGTLLLDVTPLSLGIATAEGGVAHLIPRNAAIPATATDAFTTFVDGQTAVKFTVVQGERELARDNRTLGEFTLRGIPPMPAGLPRLEVRFTLDADGVLRVAARETRSGAAAEIEVAPRHGLTDAEVERMLKDAWDHAEEDLRARRVADLRERLEIVLRAARKQKSAGAALDARTRARIAEACEDADDALATGEAATPGALQGALDELEAATLPLAEALMDALAAGALRGKRLEELEARPGAGGVR
jgi:molecular chaperone DnaK (HSP70)